MRRAIGILVAAALWGQAPAPPEPPLTGGQLEQEQLRQLLSLRRVYVDRMGGGAAADQIRAMLIAALQRARLFILTEDENRADAFLRGSAEDLIFTETHSSREGLQIRGSGAASSREGGESRAASAGFGVGETDDRYSRERKHEAAAALRLVARDGDVLWSTTQESLGGKYRGSAADVAAKVTKELTAAYERARKREGGKF